MTHPAFIARIDVRQHPSGRWTAVTCLTSGSMATSGATPDQAIDRLRTKIPGCYNIMMTTGKGMQ